MDENAFYEALCFQTRRHGAVERWTNKIMIGVVDDDQALPNVVIAMIDVHLRTIHRIRTLDEAQQEQKPMR